MPEYRMSSTLQKYLTRDFQMLYKAGMDYSKFLAISAKRRERARALRLAGMSAIEIAKKLGVSRQRVYQLLK